MFALSIAGRRTATGLCRSQLPPFSAVAFRTFLTTPPRATVPTEKLTFDENLTLLNTQRSKRPNSPHFTIYQPQITWIGSIANRVTGVGLSAGLYIGAITYLFHPYLPGLDSAHIVEFVAGFPSWLKYSLKVVAAAPFSYHTWNGIRHLLWDSGFFLSVKEVTYTGWVVVGLTAISSIGLVAFI